MQNKSLFRNEALNAKQLSWLGNIILIRPISFTVMTVFASSVAILIILFIFWGTYTKRTTVTGQLIPNTGLVQVYAPQAGIVLKKQVSEGQDIKKGNILYVLSSELQSSPLGDTQNIISQQVKLKEQSLKDELIKTKAIQSSDKLAQEQKVNDLQAEMITLVDQIQSQKSRVSLAHQTLNRYQGLLNQDYISKEQFQQKQEDLLDQRNRLQALERDRINTKRELDTQKNILSNLSLNHQNQLGQINRSLNSLAQELTESEAKRIFLIKAPQSGIATTTTAEIGQMVYNNKPLVSIVPNNSTLQAQLYAPSKSIGFIKIGDSVLLRYQAYPYQKFGHAHGKIISISKTALPSNEIANMSISNNTTQNGEPLYRITVRLNQQTVKAYGKIYNLQSGMLLDADILQDKRHIYEWVLEPLYSLTGKL